MSRIITVTAIGGTQTRPVGSLYCHTQSGHPSATFAYDDTWVRRPEGFALAPDMPMGRGPLQTPTGQALFGPFMDTTPDRWGRKLMRQAVALGEPHAMGDPRRALLDVDYLMRVGDGARQGALRFAFAETPDQYEAPASRASMPSLMELEHLVESAGRIERGTATPADIHRLAESGSSLGGARPKVSVVLDDDRLALAKFPSEGDTRSVARWEALALRLAADAGIQTPGFRVMRAGGHDVLLVDRFDRGSSGQRIPYVSAMTMLGARDGETRSTIEIAEIISQTSSDPAADREQLWRRLCLNILISNTDNHLRNHGFLYTGHGWRLAPVFDLNPVPVSEKERRLATRIGIEAHTARADLQMAIGHAAYFDMTPDEARRIAQDVGAAVAQWRQRADELGIPARQVKRMTTAFEHADLELASSWP